MHDKLIRDDQNCTWPDLLFHVVPSVASTVHLATYANPRLEMMDVVASNENDWVNPTLFALFNEDITAFAIPLLLQIPASMLHRHH